MGSIVKPVTGYFGRNNIPAKWCASPKKNGGSKSGWWTARHATRAGGGEEEMVIMYDVW